MGGARREVRWETLDASLLDDEGRAKVGATWLARMQQEHLAVGAFALLTSELAAEGCNSTVLRLIARAPSDELRHADVCRKVASALLGEENVPRRLRGVPTVPEHAKLSTAERTLLHVVEMCCLSETFTGVYLTQMLARAREPAVRAALESLLEDEIDHGRVGWAYLASARRLRASEALSRELPDMIERTIGWVIDKARAHPEADDPKLEAFGYLGNDTGAELAARTITDVVLPGFAAVQVDLGPTRERIAERRWQSR